MNESLTLHPDGRTSLSMRRRLPHPPEKVWRALTEPGHLAAWFPAEVTFDGDRVGYGFGPGGRVTHREPPRLLAHTWGEDHLRWELEPDEDGGTLLTLTHTFSDRHGAASFAAGWHTCLIALLAHLDGRSPAAAPADMGRLHEDYVHILGLGAVTRDGGTVRVERQLVRPAAQVWRHLDGDRAAVGEPPPAPFTVPSVPAGPVTRAEPGRLLQYATPGGSVRWELGEGTGHGARLVLTCTGGTAAPDAWRSRAAEVAAELAEEI
ncbi:hypothetical protein Nocox_21615 [Nonomuraea coxensis DSM 45129]|uniref:Activator of Hsp90 ATPase homologue 1/2-like C-terminal domain-containing protein n=1 Tax=Nonomuraea coxensis DSM 45129 TaxID=1122611 RepID=A0ABX8U2G1_9ACTN|nr:SRPBCC family protein [Nonomuraea coxensis]QYC41927.1 hypothetical protein Nocox_21615 [Nonomuraea coxensis DSM 45129]